MSGRSGAVQRVGRSGRAPTVVGGALGECVHVAGIYNFLRLAEAQGWRTVFLGPAVSPEAFIGAVQETDADLVALSYRLTPENGETLLRDFRQAVEEAGLGGKRFCFGGTPPVVARARALGWIERCFDGTEPVESAIGYLRGDDPAAGQGAYPESFRERLAWKHPYPLLRHHFGLPTVEATAAGIARDRGRGVIDVISLGTDQDAQEHFFHPERQDPRRKGAGGVPVRSAGDFRRLFDASRTGNHPLLRTYAGTTDLIPLAELYQETIKNAWCAVPLFWFNAMDGRGPMPLEESVRARQETMAWHGARDLPVELNEPHHWGMRDAPDTVFCASAFLSAYNARAFGVRDYLAQFMFNSPPGTSDAMDLAKMLACLDLIEPLAREGEGGDPRLRHLPPGAHRAAELPHRPGRGPGAARRVGLPADGPAPPRRARRRLLGGGPRGDRRGRDRGLQDRPAGDPQRPGRAAGPGARPPGARPPGGPRRRDGRPPGGDPGAGRAGGVRPLGRRRHARPRRALRAAGRAAAEGEPHRAGDGGHPHRGRGLPRRRSRVGAPPVRGGADRPPRRRGPRRRLSGRAGASRRLPVARHRNAVPEHPAQTSSPNVQKERAMILDAEIITVVGAGHGGKAMAAYLAIEGWRVNLYNRTAARIEGARLRGGIELEREDGSHSFGPLHRVTADAGEALEGAGMVMVVVPSSAHQEVAQTLAPHLKDGQVVLLNPGRTGGALEFRHTLRRAGCAATLHRRRGVHVHLRQPQQRPGGRQDLPGEERHPRRGHAGERHAGGARRPEPGLPPVRPGGERAAHQPGQHGRHLPPRPDHPQRRADRVPPGATTSSTSRA